MGFPYKRFYALDYLLVFRIIESKVKVTAHPIFFLINEIIKQYMQTADPGKIGMKGNLDFRWRNFIPGRQAKKSKYSQGRAGSSGVFIPIYARAFSQLGSSPFYQGLFTHLPGNMFFNLEVYVQLS